MNVSWPIFVNPKKDTAMSFISVGLNLEPLEFMDVNEATTAHSMVASAAELDKVIKNIMEVTSIVPVKE